MALSAALVWEVRTAGNNANGGAFKAGASGTDYSQQDAAQVVFPDLAIDAATATLVASTASPFTAAHVGNVLNITGGTGFSVGRYEVVAVTAGAATLDRAVGTLGSTGGAGRLGGALATLATLAGSIVASNRAWVRAGTYPLTAALTFAQADIYPSNSVPYTALLGYAATRGDLSTGSTSARPLLRADAGMTATDDLLGLVGHGWRVENLEIAAGTGAFASGLRFQGLGRAVNCKVSGYSSTGIYVLGTDCDLIECEVSGGVTGAFAGMSIQNTNSHIYACVVRDNPCCGISIGSANCVVGDSLIVNNTGGSSDGIRMAALNSVERCTVHGNGRDGIRLTAMSYRGAIRNNLLTSNGGYGLNCLVSGTPAMLVFDGNCYHNNTSGTFIGLSDTSGVNGSGPYTYTLNVTLSASPYVAAAAGDFRLNTTAGGGAAARGAGVPRTWPGSSVVGYPDFGAIQRQDTGGGTIISFMGF